VGCRWNLHWSWRYGSGNVECQANVMTESSPDLGNCDRNELLMETHDAGFFDYGLPILLGGSLHICTHHWVLMKSWVVMATHQCCLWWSWQRSDFVGNSHKLMRALVVRTLIRLGVCTLCQVTFKLLLWRFLGNFMHFVYTIQVFETEIWTYCIIWNRLSISL